MTSQHLPDLHRTLHRVCDLSVPLPARLDLARRTLAAAAAYIREPVPGTDSLLTGMSDRRAAHLSARHHALDQLDSWTRNRLLPIPVAELLANTLLQIAADRTVAADLRHTARQVYGFSLDHPHLTADALTRLTATLLSAVPIARVDRAFLATRTLAHPHAPAAAFVAAASSTDVLVRRAALTSPRCPDEARTAAWLTEHQTTRTA